MYTAGQLFLQERVSAFSHASATSTGYPYR